MARALVTGGAGFIGSHVCDALSASGYELVVIDNMSSGSRANICVPAKIIELDVREEKARQVVEDEKPDVLVHCAAQISVRESMRDPVFDVQVNVVGLVNLLQGCRNKAVQPYVTFISTGGAIYGEQDVFPAPESHEARPTSIYGQSKRACELYLDFWRREFGLKYAALRLGNVYGPRQNPHGEAGVVAIFNEVLLSGKTPYIFGSGEQTRDFVFVGDVARAVKAVCADRVSGTYNIGTGRETSVNELYAHIARAQKSNLKPIYAPAKPGEQMRSVIDASAAKKAFGWTPEKSVEQGIGITCNWFAESHKK